MTDGPTMYGCGSRNQLTGKELEERHAIIERQNNSNDKIERLRKIHDKYMNSYLDMNVLIRKLQHHQVGTTLIMADIRELIEDMEGE